MTKFITYYNLCPLHDPNDFLGLSQDHEEGRIITTFGRNVIVTQLDNQKQIRSWSTLEKLSTKVIYDHNIQKYVGLFGNSYIRCWDESNSDINKCRKLKFHKSVADLVNFEKTTLVVYTDGKCEELDYAIKARKNKETIEEQFGFIEANISDVKVSVFPDGKKCVTLFKKNQNQEDLILLKVNFDNIESRNSSSDVQKYEIKRENLNVNLAGYSVIDGDDGPLLLTIWSDKRMFLLDLKDSLDSEKCPGNFVSMLNVLRVDTPVSIVGISRHFVAIYGSNSSQEGASLLLYNTQFKAIKAKQFFKIYFTSSRLWAENDHLVAALGQNLSVIKYRISKELLSDFIGTQCSNSFQTPLDNDQINEEDALQEGIRFSHSSPEEKLLIHNSVNSVKSSKTDNIFADGKQIAFESVFKFDQDLKILNMFAMDVDVVQTDRSYDSIQVNLASDIHDNGFFTTEIQLIAQQLEKCGASEHEISEKLLFVLVKCNLYKDVAVCLRRYTNIPGKVLAKTLKYVLSNILNERNNAEKLSSHDNLCSSSSNQIKKESNNCANVQSLEEFLKKYRAAPLVKDLLNILNAVVCCTFDTDTFGAHLSKEVEYEQALLMLEYLYIILTEDYRHEQERVFGSEWADVEPSVFRWFGIFLSTHFQKLALARDTNRIDILYKWHEIFLLYKKEIVELEHVASLLYNLVQQKKVCNEKNYSKWYSIEEVNLY